MSRVETLLRASLRCEGLLRTAVHHHLAAPGKRLRAQLAVATGKALAAESDPILHLAAACELIHEASIVHDDLQDGDDRRRGQPAVWSRFGAETAISLGDLMINQSFGLLLQAPTDAERRCKLAALLQDSVRQTVFGQSLEESQVRDFELTTSDYFAFATAKTGYLLAMPVVGGVIVAGQSESMRSAVRDTMLAVGAAYQVLDDLWDLLGLKTRSKPGADLAAGKMTYPTILFRDNVDSQRRREFRQFMASDEQRADDTTVERWRRSIANSNAVATAQATVDDLRARAESTCSALPRELQELLHGSIRKMTTGPGMPGHRVSMS